MQIAEGGDCSVQVSERGKCHWWWGWQEAFCSWTVLVLVCAWYLLEKCLSLQRRCMEEATDRLFRSEVDFLECCVSRLSDAWTGFRILRWSSFFAPLDAEREWTLDIRAQQTTCQGLT